MFISLQIIFNRAFLFLISNSPKISSNNKTGVVPEKSVKIDISDKNILSMENDYVINKIVSLDKKILVGTSKSNCSIYGCEYQPIISVYK